MAGDVHGDEGRFRSLASRAARWECEAIVQLGDLGYWPRIRHYRDFLTAIPEALEANDLDLYFIEGNHDDIDTLVDRDFYAIGAFRNVAPRMYYAPRGSRWTWAGVRFLAVGGAFSHDWRMRIRGYDWFERETLSDDELAAILADRRNVDVLLSHDCPLATGSRLGLFSLSAALMHQRALETIVDQLSPLLVFHGHLHRAHRSRYVSESSKQASVVVGLADETARHGNVLVLDLLNLQRHLARMRRAGRA